MHHIVSLNVSLHWFHLESWWVVAVTLPTVCKWACARSLRGLPPAMLCQGPGGRHWPGWWSPTGSQPVGLRPPSSLSPPPTGVSCAAPRIRERVVSSLAPSREGETLQAVPRPRFTPRGLTCCTAAPPPAGPGRALTSRWPHFSSPARWAAQRSWPPPRRPASAFCWAGSVGARGMLCEETSVRCASWGWQASQEAGEHAPSSSSWKGDKSKDKWGGSFRPEINKAVDSQQLLRTLPPHRSFL